MRHIASALGCVSTLFVQVPAAFAQITTVQEPSLETFGVATTVSVPDRGRTSVAGVGRSAASRSMYGPIRTGTSMGLSTQRSGLSVQARIHDLAEMDRATLETAEQARKARDEARLSESGEHAYETLRARRHGRGVAKTPPGAVSASAPIEQDGTKREPAEGPSTEKLLERARQAESAGKRELALAFLRGARDKGSADAEKRDRSPDPQKAVIAAVTAKERQSPASREAGLCPKGAGCPQAAREGIDKVVECQAAQPASRSAS